jgi:Peptidase family M28
MPDSVIDLDFNSLVDFLDIPIGCSDGVFEKFNSIPNGMTLGTSPERFFYQSGYRDNKVLLVAHADSFWDGMECPQHRIVQSGDILYSSSPDVGIAADNRGGCAIVWLLRELGHSILITDGEEQGLVGSKFLVDEHPDLAEEVQRDHQFVIQLDRANATDYKCYDVGSDSFREYIEATTGYLEPDRYSCTDIVELCTGICGVNLSVGFQHEHTPSENLNLNHWRNTLSICRRWLCLPDIPRFEIERESYDWGGYWDERP